MTRASAATTAARVERIRIAVAANPEITTTDLAERFGISISALYRLCEKHGISLAKPTQPCPTCGARLGAQARALHSRQCAIKSEAERKYYLAYRTWPEPPRTSHQKKPQAPKAKKDNGFYYDNALSGLIDRDPLPGPGFMPSRIR